MQNNTSTIGRDVSPNRVRIQEIAEKMHNMTTEQADDKQSKLEVIDNRIKAIEDKM